MFSEYASFEALEVELQSHAKQHVWQLCRNLRHYTSEQMVAEFGEDYQILYARPLYRRGNFYCNTKGCQRKIHFRRDVEKKIYVINETLSNRVHNHQFKSEAAGSTKVISIEAEKECTDEQVSYIMSLGPAKLGVSKVREILSMMYKGRNFGSDLLYRLLQKGYLAHWGKDPHCISKFMERGYIIRNDGGIFVTEMASDCRISEVFVQPASMKPYVKVFGDFAIHDGTFNVDKYGFVAMVVTLVDSLGKSTMAGYSLAPSEHSDHILKALQLFGMDMPDSVYMTDQGSGFVLAAQQLHKIHLLCAKHYTSAILAARSGTIQISPSLIIV